MTTDEYPIFLFRFWKPEVLKCFHICWITQAVRRINAVKNLDISYTGTNMWERKIKKKTCSFYVLTCLKSCHLRAYRLLGTCRSFSHLSRVPYHEKNRIVLVITVTEWHPVTILTTFGSPKPNPFWKQILFAVFSRVRGICRPKNWTTVSHTRVWWPFQWHATPIHITWNHVTGDKREINCPPLLLKSFTFGRFCLVFAPMEPIPS